MASIILGPGEQFEHQHANESETILRRGKVRISIGEQKEKEMRVNQPVKVPASTPHRLRNEGDEYAIIDCHHDPRRRT